MSMKLRAISDDSNGLTVKSSSEAGVDREPTSGMTWSGVAPTEPVAPEASWKLMLMMVNVFSRSVWRKALMGQQLSAAEPPKAAEAPRL